MKSGSYRSDSEVRLVVDRGIYETPKAYEAAFSYRDIPREVDVLLSWYGRWNGQRRVEPRTVLELAAGPAAHARELAKRNKVACAVDLSPEMCAYARNRAMRQGVEISTSVSDIRQFRLRTRFDLAILMLDSGSHLLTSEDMDRHLENVAFHVRRGGIYVLEFAYPSSPKSRSKTQERWTIHRPGVDLSVAWRSVPRPAVTPPRYLSRVEISGTLRSRKVAVSEEMLLRSWSKRAVQNAVSRTQAFEVASVLGDFSEQSVFDRNSWRMIFVLLRTGD